MNEGVEWAMHSCLNLCWMESEGPVPAARLASFYDLPTAYLNKQLQALSRAGILTSTSGPRGGFRLARSPETITLLDVVVAIEGSAEAFRCHQILRSGPGGDPATDYVKTCLISQAMRGAELAWRRILSEQTIADLRDDVEQKYPSTPANTRHWFATVRR